MASRRACSGNASYKPDPETSWDFFERDDTSQQRDREKQGMKRLGVVFLPWKKNVLMPGRLTN